MNVDWVTVQLGVVANLKEGDKLGLDSSGGLIIDQSGVTQSAWRIVTRQRRADVLSALWTLVSQCEQLAAVFTDPASIGTNHTRVNLKGNVSAAVNGIETLRETYTVDGNTVSQLDLMGRKLTECARLIKVLDTREQ